MTEATRRSAGGWLESLGRLPERYPGVTILVIGGLLALAYTSALWLLEKPDGRIVVGDATHYYVYLRSAVFDGDLHFRNDYVRLYGLQGGEAGTEWVYEPTATGHVRNMMSVGPPILWAPLFLLTCAAVAAGGAMGWSYPLDGFGRLFQAAAGLSGVAAATLGVWLAYRLASRLVGPRAAIWSTVTVWLGSNAIYYSTISPTYSHATSMLATGALFYTWASTIDRQTTARYAAVGALAGLGALVRWQDAVFLILPLTDVARQVWRAADRARATRLAVGRLAVCGAAALAVFSPQVMAWVVLYGRPVAMPQGSDWMQWGAPYLAHVLLSDWHGLLTWTPVVALCLAGLIPLARLSPPIATGMIAAFLASWYANGSVVEWWAGEAYGARRFVSCFPIFVVGLAALAHRFRDRPRPLVAVAVLLVAHNGLLLLQYQLFMHGLRDLAPYPRGLVGLWLARFWVPFDLLQWLWNR